MVIGDFLAQHAVEECSEVLGHGVTGLQDPAGAKCPDPAVPSDDDVLGFPISTDLGFDLGAEVASDQRHLMAHRTLVGH